jgi:transforming growth factor-beta-induced protein
MFLAIRQTKQLFNKQLKYVSVLCLTNAFKNLNKNVMKKRNLSKIFSLRGLVFIGITSAALVLASCSKEEDAYLEESMKAEQEAMLKGAPAKGSESIAQIAIDNDFDELVSALAYVDGAEGTSLVNLFLNGKDQYTVFAPTDEAFFALYEFFGVEEVTELPSATVLSVLYYHVAEGRRASNSVVPKKGVRTIETLLGASFDVKANLEIEAIGNTANIVAADISASNGIIHVIDAVILPIEVN